MTAGDCDLDRAFHVSLPFHVGEIDIVGLMGCKKTSEIAACRQKWEFAAQKLKGLPKILHAVDVDLFHHGGFERVCLRNKQRLFAASSRF